jgi:hypothetical protein
MRASDNWLLTGHEGLRASDAERDEAIGELRDRFAEGRLSQETFLYRIDAALRAKDRSELSDLFADLPSGKRDAGRALASRLAMLWRVPRERLSAQRWRARRPMTSTSWPPGHDRLIAPQAAMSGAAAGQADISQFPAREPPSLCLPRQADRRFTIGRAPSCDFTVADLSVSRWHARLHNEDGNWLLSDLGSTNGTRLNGWRVTSAVPVQAGDSVSFGSAAYVVIDRPALAAHPSGTG